MKLNIVLIYFIVNIFEIYTKSVNSINYKNEDGKRYKRYLGLNKKFKLNKRYQECLAPGDLQGHCKHAFFCPIDVLRSSRNHLDSLCVIEESFIGVCCPDDIISSKVQGSNIVMDLPASGLDYSDNDSNTGCGLRSMAKRIESQNLVQKWPWITALYLKNVTYEQFCGGSLISDRHILTASHCLDGLNIKDIRVRLGEYDFLNLTETRSQDFSLESMIMHEYYDRTTYDNDIAIIELDRSANFNSYIWPICLPPVDRSFVNETVIAAGWGQVFSGGPTSELLLEVSMPVWPKEKCVEAFTQKISDDVICAAGYEGNRDSCKGDSGGPLLFQLENGRWVTIGVVSWGIGCGNKGKPGIYTRVNRYLPWIVRNTLIK